MAVKLNQIDPCTKGWGFNYTNGQMGKKESLGALLTKGVKLT